MKRKRKPAEKWKNVCECYCAHSTELPWWSSAWISGQTLHHLRSADTGTLFVPRTTTTLGMMSFAVAAPPPHTHIWNSLPAALQTATLSPLSFARHLKSHLFGWDWQCVWGLFRMRSTNLRIINIIIIILAQTLSTWVERCCGDWPRRLCTLAEKAVAHGARSTLTLISSDSVLTDGQLMTAASVNRLCALVCLNKPSTDSSKFHHVPRPVDFRLPQTPPVCRLICTTTNLYDESNQWSYACIYT